MFYTVRALSIACITVFSLAACGGDGASTPKAAQSGTVVPGNQGRAVRSIPCTPDSYGYCYVHTFHHAGQTLCDGGGGYSTVVTDKYEVYNSTTDLGLYVRVDTTDCDLNESIGWHPGDPAVVYSDPNLP